LIAAILGYGVLLYSPPRIEIHDDDTIFYMSQAHNLAEGTEIKNRIYPTGYAHILAAVHVEMGRPWYRVVLTNLVFLTIGMIAVYRLLPTALGLPARESAAICVLSLFSWLQITYVPRQLPELAFFGTSALCLLFASRALTGERFLVRFVIAVVLAGAAIWIRSIGVALIPVVLYVFGKRARRSDDRLIRLALPAVCLVGLCAALLFRHQWMRPNYSSGFTYTISHPGTTVTHSALWCVRGVGEVSQNISSTAFEPREQEAYGNGDDATLEPRAWTIIDSEARALSYVVGACGLVLIFLGLVRTPFNVVALYLFGYGFILLLWPLGLSRYFVPVVPFLLGYGWAGIKSPQWRIPTRALAVYVGAFCLCGMIAMGNEWVMVFHNREQTYRAFTEIVWAFQNRLHVQF